MGNAHTEALVEIKAHMLGEVQEISRHTPWGFYNDFALSNISVRDFLSAEYIFYPTRIAHILSGEGQSLSDVLSVIGKALDSSLKLLILEHNPAAPDWKNNAKVNKVNLTAIEDFLNAGHYVYDKVHIGDKGEQCRNLLYIVTCIPYLDATYLNNSRVRAELARVTACANGCDATRKIYALTSENYRSPAKIFKPEVEQAINAANATVYTIIGGLMFLDMLAQINPPELFLYDLSFRQCLYAAVLVNVIVSCETVGAFEDFMRDPKLNRSLYEKLNYLWPFIEFRRSLLETRQKTATDKFEYRWRNLLYVGAWKKNFDKVKHQLLVSLKRIFQTDLTKFTPPAGSIVYTSSIDRKFFAHLTNHLVVQAVHPRDCPSIEDRRNSLSNPA